MDVDNVDNGTDDGVNNENCFSEDFAADFER